VASWERLAGRSLNAFDLLKQTKITKKKSNINNNNSNLTLMSLVITNNKKNKTSKKFI